MFYQFQKAETAGSNNQSHRITINQNIDTAGESESLKGISHERRVSKEAEEKYRIDQWFGGDGAPGEGGMML